MLSPSPLSATSTDALAATSAAAPRRLRRYSPAVAIVGGGGELATSRLQPAIARREDRRFVCLDLQPEPPLHAYRRWQPVASVDETAAALQRTGFTSVYLTTPPQVTGALLPRLLDSPQRLVVAEKPWFAVGEQGLALAHRAQGSSPNLRFFDHYLHRGAVAFLRTVGLEELLGGSEILSLEFRLHEMSPPSSQAQAQTGALADLAVHGASLVRTLLPGLPLYVVRAGAAKFAGSPFPAETYAWLLLEAEHDSRPTVFISAGKYIPPRLAGKSLTIVGRHARLELDLAADTLDRVLGDRRQRLYPLQSEQPENAYALLVRCLAAGNGDRLGHSLADALAVSSWLFDARRLFPHPLPEIPAHNYPL